MVESDRGPVVERGGLLLTVLGEFVLPGGGSAWTQTLLTLLEQLGVKDKAARQALARMHDRGLLDRERVGRKTRWSLTDRSRQVLTDGAQRIYGFGQSPRPWDGTWLVVLTSVPERDRQVRYRMGVELGWAGFGSLGNGMWVSPWGDQESLAVETVSSLGIDATSFRGRLGQLGSGAELAAQAWDLPALRVGYDGFLAEVARSSTLTDSGARAVDGSAAATALASIVHLWRRFPFVDPELPAELLPSDWPGPVAADRFAAVRAELLAPATDWWRHLDHEAGR